MIHFGCGHVVSFYCLLIVMGQQSVIFRTFNGVQCILLVAMQIQNLSSGPVDSVPLICLTVHQCTELIIHIWVHLCAAMGSMKKYPIPVAEELLFSLLRIFLTCLLCRSHGFPYNHTFFSAFLMSWSSWRSRSVI